MSLIAIITDTHFGANNSNNMFLRYQDKYFENLVQTLTELGVTDLFHAGDLYDVRKSINFKTLRQSASFFRERMLAAPFNVHIVVGNHDSYSKNTLKINAPNELLGWTDFKIYQEPEEIEIDGRRIAVIPWICHDNEQRCVQLIEDTYADVCIGHFDIAGFGMSKEIINKVGLSRSIFKKFVRTFSGHFHLPSEQDNIIYVGSPYQLSWSDYGDTKRVILYDTKTDSIRSLENEESIFEKIYYKDGIEVEDGVYNDKILKIYTDESHDSYKFDLFVKRIQEQNPYSVSVIDGVKSSDVVSDIADMNKDTMEFLVECIDALDIPAPDKDETKALMLKLYTKAQEII